MLWWIFRVPSSIPRCLLQAVLRAGDVTWQKATWKAFLVTIFAANKAYTISAIFLQFPLPELLSFLWHPLYCLCFDHCVWPIQIISAVVIKVQDVLISFLFQNKINHTVLKNLLDPIKELYEDVRRKALMRLEYEGLHKSEAITTPGVRFYNDPAGYAMNRYAYYVCYKCKKVWGSVLSQTECVL